MNRHCITDEIIKGKESLRKQIKEIRKTLDPFYIDSNSKLICNEIMTFPCFKEADIVYAYAGCKGEVATDGLILSSLAAGKKVALPKVMGDEIVFFCIDDPDELESGFMGIPEPAGNKAAGKSDAGSAEAQGASGTEEKAVLIVPGVGYDITGSRLGFGGGYYDRFIAGADMAFTAVIAPAFDFQIFDEIPGEEHDAGVDIIVTPKRVIDVNGILR